MLHFCKIFVIICIYRFGTGSTSEGTRLLLRMQQWCRHLAIKTATLSLHGFVAVQTVVMWNKKAELSQRNCAMLHVTLVTY